MLLSFVIISVIESGTKVNEFLAFAKFDSMTVERSLLGIGDWGLGIGDWAQSPIPNPQSPIPNPQSPQFLSADFS